MNILLQLFILILATWRISNLLTNEDGPFQIFLTIRTRFAKLELFDCLWCTSVWVGMALTATYFFIDFDILQWFLLPFVLSAGAILFDRYSQ